jgi:large subunit ribosomal protein L10
MPKSRAQKEQLLSELTNSLGTAKSAVILSVQGVKVGEFESIRDELFKGGMYIHVAKNSLLKRALAEQNQDVPADLLDQPVALVFSFEDEVAAAKAIAPFAKDIEALSMLGGMVNGSFINAKQVEALAKLPSREQLIAQLLGTLQAPVRGLATVLQGNLRGLVTVLTRISEQQA